MQKSHKNGNRRLGTRVAVIAGTAGAVLAFAAPMASAQDPVDNSVPGAQCVRLLPNPVCRLWFRAEPSTTTASTSRSEKAT